MSALLYVLLAASAASAQGAKPSPQTETQLLAAGWAALAGNQPTQVRSIAGRLAAMESSRKSSAALAFLVEAGLAQGGPSEALKAYDQWLNGRNFEEPYALRRIGVAILKDAVSGQDPQARAEALDALAADGDASARAAMTEGIQKGQVAEVFAAAARGDATAVQAVLEHLQTGRGNQMRAIEVAGESRDPRAAAVLVDILSRDHSDLRGPAAEALARLGATQAIPQIKSLLNDPVPPVRFAAAAALYRLGDTSGLDILETAATSEHSGVRIDAADALSARPDARWRSLVDQLADDSDPMIRLRAARLLAPHDPARATEILETLGKDANPGIRELAGRTLGSLATDDVATLRRLMAGPDPLARVRAAGRVLTLTR